MQVLDTLQFIIIIMLCNWLNISLVVAQQFTCLLHDTFSFLKYFTKWRENFQLLENKTLLKSLCRSVCDISKFGKNTNTTMPGLGWIKKNI